MSCASLSSLSRLNETLRNLSITEINLVQSTIMNGSGPNKQLPAESIPLFQEGIYLILSRWSALQLAVQNEWGGLHSRQLAEHLGSDIFSWFTQSKEPLYMDDLENILDEGMLSLNTMIEDDSVEEVAEKLMIMHEECLEGDYSSIENLRQAVPIAGGHQHIEQAAADDDDDNDDDDDGRGDNRSNMMVDAPQSRSISSNQPNMRVDKPAPSGQEAAPEEDGWTTVSSSRRNRGRGKRN